MSFFTGEEAGRAGACPRCGVTCALNDKGEVTLHRAPVMAPETWCLHCPGNDGLAEFERSMDMLLGKIVSSMGTPPLVLSGQLELLPMPELERLAKERLAAVEKPNPLEKTLAPPKRRTPPKPVHLCKGGTKPVLTCGQCQYVFHCAVTGRTPKQTYDGWRTEFISYGGDYAKKAMLEQVTEQTRCVIDPPEKPEPVPVRRMPALNRRESAVLLGVVWGLYTVVHAIAVGTPVAAAMVFVSMWVLLFSVFCVRPRNRP